MKSVITLLLCSLMVAAAAPDRSVHPVSQEAPAPADSPALPVEEEKIRSGIVMLAGLYDILAKIQDKESAENAVVPIMRFSGQLQAWGQSFGALPPLDDETRKHYEQKYLPVIERLNNRIQTQADRIASAEFYGSRNLPAALIKLITDFQ